MSLFQASQTYYGTVSIGERSGTAHRKYGLEEVNRHWETNIFLSTPEPDPSTQRRTPYLG